MLPETLPLLVADHDYAPPRPPHWLRAALASQYQLPGVEGRLRGTRVLCVHDQRAIVVTTILGCCCIGWGMDQDRRATG